MEPKNREDLADRLLDAALKRYSSAEPRAGLESRVLVRLRVEQERRASVLVNWWLAPAGAAILVIVASGVLAHRGTETVIPGTVSSSKQVSAVRPSPILPGSAPLTQLGSLGAARNPAASRKINSVKPETREARLKQFPSSRPLSQEEELLRAFVTEAPKEQLVMAAAMMKSENLQIKSLEIPSLEGDAPASRSNEKDH